MSYGGASTSTQHLHQSLRWFFGIAAVATDLGHVLLVDLCLDDLSCSQSELEASGKGSEAGSVLSSRHTDCLVICCKLLEYMTEVIILLLHQIT